MKFLFHNNTIYIYYYKNQVDSYNQMVYDILTKEIPLINLEFIKNK